MGIMDIFRTKPAEDQAQQIQQPAATNPAANTTSDGKMPGSSQEPVDPLQQYGKMFQAAEEASKNQEVAPSFTLDPTKIGEVSNSLDFTSNLDPALVQSALGGDPQALIKLINLSGQQVYKTAMHHQSALTDRFVGARTAHEFKKVDAQVKSTMVDNALSSVPNYQNPVVKQQLSMVAKQFAAGNPDATPEEIRDMAIQYMSDLTNAILPPKQAHSQSAKEVDWDQYFN